MFARSRAATLLFRPPGRRGRRALAAAVAIAIATSLLSAQPWAGAADGPARPPGEKVDAVGGPVTGKAWAEHRVRYAAAPPAVWPKPATSRVAVADPPSGAVSGAARGVKAANAPVWVARGTGEAGRRPTAVDVTVLNRATVPVAWRDGLMMVVTTPPGAATGTVKLSVDYGGFRYAGGADWASRLRLWQVPGCALTRPDDRACGSVPLRTTNDPTTGIASAEVGAGPTGTMVALAAAPSGSDGDFGATNLTASSTWVAGVSSGDFTWTYPVRTPPAAGPTPTINLGYSSAAVDGRSQVTNNQPSIIGEGFEYSPGYIERRYVPCSEDQAIGANNPIDTGDQCWRSDNATMNLNGSGSELVFENGKGWHRRGEDGSKIEKLSNTVNGDNNNEYWKVTTPDGTQYFFGLNTLPGQTSPTNSTLTVPVFGNHVGEPCNAATFAASSCAQAWRWHLDYAIDVRGNTMSFWYEKETNKYARNATDSDDVAYDRAGLLRRIDYGTYDRTVAEHDVAERSTTPYAQVLFDLNDRCVNNCWNGTEPNRLEWKDTPWDQECKAMETSCPQQFWPTFWSTKRLSKITTRVLDTTKTPAAWQNVESWTFTHTFAASADSTHTGLWLDRIDHAGLVGETVTLPPVTFSAVSKPNRVLTAHNTTNNWLRISDIVTESGARIHVDYTEPDCAATSLPAAAHTNTRRCYPVLVPDPTDPTGVRLITEWWHKYVVAHVAESDVQVSQGQSPTRHTRYEYVDAAWHYADDDGLSKPDRRTWNQWRGYRTVKTRVGDNPATRSLTVTTYLRGMHGDRAAPAGGTRTETVSASLGSETVYDEDQFAGMVREQAVYNGVESKPVGKTVNVPWRSDPTATRSAVQARFADTQTTYTATALGLDGARGWRSSRVVKNLDATYGTTNWQQDDGDLAGPGDEQCVTFTYNRNLGKNLVATVSRTTTTALPCGQAPASVDDVIADQRVSYDGATSPATAPRFGQVTRTERLRDWVSGTGTVWQTASQATYDSTGRPRTATDIKSNVTTTSYTPAVGGPVTKMETTGPAPLHWLSTVEKNPYWGSRTRSTDPNGRVTADVVYDALGRVSKVWASGWTKSANPDKPSAQYTYDFASNRDRYPNVASRLLNPDGNVVVAHQIFDGLLRGRQTQSISLAGDGNRVVTDTVYDEFGRAATTYGAHVEPGAPSGALWFEPEWSVPAVNRTEYDRASRPTATVFLAGDGTANLEEQWRTTTRHEGDLTRVTPPDGGVATTTVTDVLGRTVALRHHTTASGVDGPSQETRYRFNRKGQQDRVTDPAGNEWSYRFDARGLLTESVDPDTGTSTRAYNEFDELVSTTDARGEKLWHVYDQIGRKRQLRDDSATGALRAEWKYDTLYTGQTGFRGQLTETIRYEPAGTSTAYKWQVRAFNARYQPTGVNYVIPAVETGLGRTYVYAFGYSAATGAPVSITFPDGGGLVGETLTTGYDDTTGAPTSLDTSLTGFTGTMATASYTAYGERNGSTSKMPGGLYTQEMLYREESTRRVKRTTVSTETGGNVTVSDRSYEHLDVGSIKEIREAPQVGSTDAQCFRQDRLARLITAWTPKPGVTCQTDPTTANLGGPAPYWLDWTFDTTGSRRSETTHAAAGDTTRIYALPTGGPGVVRPHAVTRVTTTAPGQSAVATNYTYDASGNTVCRPSGVAANTCPPGAASQALTWNAEGRLDTVSVGGEAAQASIYDAEGARLIRRDATGTTLYLPGQEIRYQGGTTVGTRYYDLGGTIASRKGGSAISDLTWLYADHQGTAQLSINAATQAVSVRRQTPYGTPRGTSPTWVNGKGFVGGDDDPTGQVHLKARQYDQALGRFVSVDPVLDMADPHQMSGYTYANASPVSLSDPDGLDPCPGGGGGCYHDGTTMARDGATPEQMAEGLRRSRETVNRMRDDAREAKNRPGIQKARDDADRERRACQSSFLCRTVDRFIPGGGGGVERPPRERTEDGERDMCKITLGQGPLCLFRTLDRGTTGVCLGGNLAIVANFGGSGCVQADKNGVFFTWTEMDPMRAGEGSFGMGVGVGLTAQVSNARNKDGLADGFSYGEVAAGPVQIGGATGTYQGERVIVGELGGGPGVGVHGGTSTTYVSRYLFRWWW
jgi:RHS repeat-associated protein